MGARRLLLALPALCAVAAVAAGLARLGWAIPVPVAASHLVGLHGPLFVVGAFGTLVTLERAVALAASGARWPYAAPVLVATGVAVAAAGQVAVGAWLVIAGAGAFVAASVVVVRRQLVAATVVMALGAVAFAVAGGVWAWGAPLGRAVPFWIAFFLLTIAGERLELARLRRLSTRAHVAFAASVLLAIGGLVADQHLAAGLGFVSLGLWLARYDVARRTIRAHGLPRYAAAALLSGYGWLVVTGGLLLLGPVPPLGPRYDAVLHAVFVGFVVAMVFAHAPIVLPAVARVRLPYHPAFYAPLVVLQVSLAMRLGGDLAGWPWGRRVGGLGNAAALALFLGVALWSRHRESPNATGMAESQ